MERKRHPPQRGAPVPTQGGSYPVSQYCILPGNKEVDQPGPPTQPAAEAGKGGVRDLGRECVFISKAAQAGGCAGKKGRLLRPNSPDFYKGSKKI